MNGFLRKLLALCLFIVALGYADAVRAVPRVALVVGPRASGLFEAGSEGGSESHSSETSIVLRLKGELIASGFEVTTIPVSEPPSRRRLEEIAAQTDSVAAMGIAEPRDRLTLDIWVADRVTGKMVVRRVDTRGLTARAVALRAVELLRASLLELNEPHPPRGEVSAPEPVRRWIRPEPASATAGSERVAPTPPPRSAATIGVGVLGGPGGLGAAVVPSLRFTWRPEPPWETSIRFVGPAFGSVSDTRGSARVDQELLLVTFGVAASTRPFEPYVAVGLGAYHLGARGRASAPFRGSSGDSFAGLGLIAAGLRLRLTDALALFTELDASLMQPRTALRFDRSPRARSGEPLLLGSVGGEVRW